jgi:hypothetical protein
LETFTFFHSAISNYQSSFFGSPGPCGWYKPGSELWIKRSSMAVFAPIREKFGKMASERKNLAYF